MNFRPSDIVKTILCFITDALEIQPDDKKLWMGHLTVCPGSKSASHQDLDWQKQDADAHSRLIRNLLTMLELAGSCGTATRPRHSGRSLVCVGRMGCSCRTWDSELGEKLAQNGHMRVSIPTIPHTAKPIIPNVTLPEAIERLTDFLRRGATTVLTGAGVSVDSGIKAYRGQDGRYMNPNFQWVAQSCHHIQRVD